MKPPLEIAFGLLLVASVSGCAGYSVTGYSYPYAYSDPDTYGYVDDAFADHYFGYYPGAYGMSFGGFFGQDWHGGDREGWRGHEWRHGDWHGASLHRSARPGPFEGHTHAAATAHGLSGGHNHGGPGHHG